MSYVLIIGAKSDIAKEVARTYAKNGYNLYLAARESSSLEDLKQDIEVRSGVHVELKEFDITAYETHENFYSELGEKPLGAIVVSGYMVEQKLAQKDWNESLQTINVNYTGAVSILNIIANDFERERRGFIVGVSSVAGDRGRKANYIYGSSKAAFTTYLGGLRNRLYESGVNVLTVKPGFVNTKMTENLDLPEKLTAEPQDVANDIYNAQQKGRNVLYTKSIWVLVMLIIKHIPEFMFKKMSI
ncbi:SDR family oxidoreductase [Candidatus Sulfurimonas marisnigri]|uniref:SDR family oxidoreductase n=1 Tax=Candidatus Sulfurimonas marisnigri TaxID=2740405 RepID=A0A7S7LYE1_9BACT|nr:SDR family oxidoreductase [Candidatus Sulfurimonas marisnigri]QOY53732.1 SDR family oxidoreductase [Candidatus Sulfurimonas marisnigri]